MKRNRLLFIWLLIISCFLLTSCGEVKSEPDYLLEGARDEGLMPSYRAYFAIDNDNITKISKREYEKLLYKKDQEHHYKIVPNKSYSFDVKAGTNKPSEWEFVPSQYNKTTYDEEMLKDQLSAMDVSYVGDVYILITEFEGYHIIEVKNMDEHTVMDSQYAIFHDGEKLSTYENIDLSSIRCIYHRGHP